MTKSEPCDGCGRTDDYVPSLVVCRRRYENVCPECMDVLEQVLERSLVREFSEENTDE